jgi:predicted dehydrogenase
VIDVVVVGAGRWAHEGWAPLLVEAGESGRVRVVAVVDADLGRARSLAQLLGVDAAATYRTTATALDHHEGVRAGVVLTSPSQHAPTIVALARAGLHVLTEKPLVTDPGDLDVVVEAVRAAGVKAAVMQNYRFENRVRLVRRLLDDGEVGTLRYLVARFAADYREPGSWVGEPDFAWVDTAIHHVDVLRYLAGAEISHVSAVAANPDGSPFPGASVAGLLLRFADGTFALYESMLLAAGHQNRWRDVAYRVECSDGALMCDGPHVVVARGADSRTIPAPQVDVLDGHRHQLAAFLDWLDGGPPVETTIDDNGRSIAAVFAALVADRDRGTVALS